MPRKVTAAPPPPETAALGDLVSALQQELTAATASHQATVAAWKTTYANHPLLEGSAPAAMRIVSAQVVVPVAAAGRQAAPPVVPQLTRELVAAVLPPDWPKSRRGEIATAVQRALADAGKLSAARSRFVNETLLEIRRALTDEERAQTKLREQPLRELHAAAVAAVAQTNGLRFFFRAEDLAKVPAELVWRVNLDLRLE